MVPGVQSQIDSDALRATVAPTIRKTMVIPKGSGDHEDGQKNKTAAEDSPTDAS